MSKEMSGMTPQEQIAFIRRKSGVSPKDVPAAVHDQPFIARDRPRPKRGK